MPGCWPPPDQCYASDGGPLAVAQHGPNGHRGSRRCRIVWYDAVSYAAWHGQTGETAAAAVGVHGGPQDPAMKALLIGFALVMVVLLALLEIGRASCRE